jgi:hypothetical protein
MRSLLRVAALAALFLCLIPFAGADCTAPAIQQIGGTNPTCPGVPVSLDAGAGFVSYLWSTGATTRTIADTPSVSTQYSVTVTDADGCSATSAALQVDVNAGAPVPVLTPASAQVCPNTASSVSVQNAADYAFIQWTVTHAVDVVPNVATVSFTPDGSGDVVVSVNATALNMCLAQKSVTLPLNPALSAPVISAPPEACSGVGYNATVPSIYASYSWSVTNGFITFGAGTDHISFQATGAGNVILNVTVTDANGCSAVAAKTLGTATVPAITADVTGVCVGTYGHASVPASYSTYQWTITNGVIDGSATTSSIVFHATGGGPVLLNVNVRDAWGCYANAPTKQIPYGTLTAPAFTHSVRACAYDAVYASLTDSANYTTYHWTATNTLGRSTVDGLAISFISNGAGDMVLSVTATDVNGCSSPTVSQTVPLITNPAVVNITAPSSICAGAGGTASVADAGAGGTYTWSITNGTITGGNGTRTITFVPTGAQPVTVTALVGSDTACQANSSVTINVNTPPSDFSAPSGVCSGGSGYTASSYSPGYADSYSWAALENVNITSNPALSSITFSVAGTTGVARLRLTVTKNGCTGSTTVTMPISTTIPAATITAGGPTTFCSSGYVTLTASSGASYLWSNGATTQTIYATAAGDYSVTVTEAGGCRATSAPTTITLLPQPTATVTPSGPTTFCAGGSVTLTANGGVSYSWSTGATTPSITVSTAGSYYVTATGSNGCRSTGYAVVTVNTPVMPTISGNTTICPGGTTALTANPSGTSYAWSNGATTRSITVSTPGSYAVTVTDFYGCPRTSAPLTVTANPLPTITPSGSTTFCTPGSVTLTSSLGTSYTWSTGATTRAITVYSTGDYNVTVNDGTCTSTSAATHVTAKPGFSGQASISSSAVSQSYSTCPVAFNLTANPAGLSYLWSTGETTRAIQAIQDATYSVTITDPATGCQLVLSTHPSPAVMPRPTITANQTAVCPVNGGQATLTAHSSAGTVYQYSWSGPNIYYWNTPYGPTFQPTYAGNYTVTAQYTNGCSVTSDPITITMNPSPNISVTPSTSWICPGGTATLTATGGGANTTYLWSTGATTPSITVNAAGDYTVTATDPNGCSSYAQHGYVYASTPAATITPSGSTTICPGSYVLLTANSGSSYLWSNGATSSYTYAFAAGNYSVTVTDSHGCSATSAPVTVTVRPPVPAPTISASGPLAFCPGGSVTLTSSPGSSYQWSTGATTQSINVTAAGSYSVRITDANGCTSPYSNTTYVYVGGGTIYLSASGSTNFCQGGKVTFTGPSGAQSYHWSNGATTQSTDITTSGYVSLWIYDSLGCYAQSPSYQVIVDPLPNATITASGPTTFCPGGSVTLSVPAGAYSYLWSNGATTNSIAVNTAGSYTVTVKGTTANHCPVTSAPKVVTVSPPATATITASGPTTFCPGGLVVLTANSGASYLWSNGFATRSITVRDSGSYSVTVTDANGCAATSAATAANVSSLTSVSVQADRTTVCPGQTVNLTSTVTGGGSTGPLTYAWYGEDAQPIAGGNGPSLTVTPTQSWIYYVYVTDAAGCTVLSQPVNINVPVPHPTITGPAAPLCSRPATLTASAGASWLWSNGATTQSIGVSDDGDYSVTITSSAGCSATSAPYSVHFAAAVPKPAIAADGPATFCAGGSVTLTASAAASYVWSTGETTSSIHVAIGGDYSVTVTSAEGCSATSDPFVVIVNLPPAIPVITASGATTFCAGGSVTLTASAGSSYLWSNGATTQSIDVDASGAYSVTVSNANGCSASSAATTVTVNPTPATPAITASGPTTFCAGGSVTLTASAGSSYLWSNGATTHSIAVEASGAYSVTVADANGCSAGSASITVTVNANPATPTITASGPTTFCAGGSVTLTASAGSSYVWSNGATTESIAVTASGSYSVTISNANGCSASSAATSVTVNATPATPTITASGPTTFCAGGSVTLTASAGSSYVWSNGATAQSIVAGASGSFRVTVTDANGCSAQSAVTTVTVEPLPDATVTLSGSPILCDGAAVTLTAAAGGASYLWSTGATTAAISVYQPGSYSVTVTGAAGCTATSAPVVVSNEPATVTISGGPATICAGSSVHLTSNVANGTASSYQWFGFGGQPVAGATSPSLDITPSSSGYYFLRITSGNGCTVQSNTFVFNIDQPSASITSPDPVTFCAGGSARLFANAGASYLWSNGSTNPVITVNTSGSYTVTVTTANGCSATSAPFIVTVNDPPATPAITAGGPATFCAGGSVTLTASAGSSYAWSNGATTQAIAVTASGSYSVTVYDANGCSATSAAATVTVNANPPTPSITDGGPTTFCAGGSVTLTASAASSYLWSNGATTQAINVTASDSYSVMVTNASGCSATSVATTVTVNANPGAPTITAGGPTTFCAGGNVTLTASAGSSYLWSNGATTQAVNVTASGSYSVTVTNASGCSATSAATTVTVNASPATPTITVGGPTTFCTGGSVTLTASAASSYLWSNGATTQAINVTASGSYSVTVTNAGGCSATSAATTVTVNAKPTPSITAGGPTTFCAGGSVTLTASAGSSYLWSNGATTQAISATASGSYSVTVTNASGCSVTSAATAVTVNANPATPTITAGGPTTFCAGGSVTLTASAGSSYLWSNGATTQAISVTSSGAYSVTVKNAGGCGATSAATAVTVNAKPAPVITPSGATTFCTGGSVTLTSSAGSSYLWSNGATTQAINVTASGTFSVTVTNASGCSATSAATNVTVNAKPATPTITAGGATTFCAGGSVTLTSSAGTSYLWSNGATTQAINATTSGNYTVTVFNASGCGTQSAAKAVTVNAAPTFTTQPASVTINSNTRTTLTAAATSPTGTVTYQWYRGASGNTANPVGTGSSFQTPKLTTTTQYWVRASNGTCTTASNTATVTVH